MNTPSKKPKSGKKAVWRSTRKTECDWCGNKLDPEERESPRRDAQNKPMCDDCYREHFEFTCAICQNYAPKDEEGRIGLCIVVAEDWVCTAGAGIYRVLAWPMFGQPLIGCGHMYEDAIQRVADCPDPKTIDTQGAPCGYVCAACSKKFPKAKKKTLARSHP